MLGRYQLLKIIVGIGVESFWKKAYQPDAGVGILFILESYRSWIFFKNFIPAQS
jgi:hypothetical protein